ncbi:AzlD family protein [Rhodovastum atsumiense]|uniref:AzlD family protein n=1 Tax=Rhodovastum atsumiense TaxID=504468 RepID=A0A5M6IWG9_9PROT|nr:AzlD domain-containing protein [Rhodovastum atsumiense]KAA5612642.1 hypothetical protein F1189_09035 [Rhodovastum atsumiense]
MVGDPWTLPAIVLMGAATYATRIAGLFVAARLPHSGPVRRALDALPPAVLTAVIAPALAAGPAEALAGGIVVLAAFRLPLLATVAVGVATVALLRQMLGG